MAPCTSTPDTFWSLPVLEVFQLNDRQVDLASRSSQCGLLCSYFVCTGGWCTPAYSSIMELFVGLSGNSMEFLSLFLRDGVLGSLGSTIPKKKAGSFWLVPGIYPNFKELADVASPPIGWVGLDWECSKTNPYISVASKLCSSAMT